MYNKSYNRIDPIEFAKQKSLIEDVFDLSEMSRLKSMCHSQMDLNHADVRLKGGVDVQGLPYLQGTVVVVLPLTCDRCLAVVHYSLSAVFSLSPVVSDDEAKRLPSSYEPLYLSDSTVSLSEMIEEELLLVLPLGVRHEEDCSKLKRKL